MPLGLPRNLTNEWTKHNGYDIFVIHLTIRELRPNDPCKERENGMGNTQRALRALPRSYNLGTRHILL
jgi:hypothetical protein